MYVFLVSAKVRRGRASDTLELKYRGLGCAMGCSLKAVCALSRGAISPVIFLLPLEVRSVIFCVLVLGILVFNSFIEINVIHMSYKSSILSVQFSNF